MKVVREEGKAGLQARPQPGATPKLVAEELALLPVLLAIGAEAYGFPGRWLDKSNPFGVLPGLRAGTESG